MTAVIAPAELGGLPTAVRAAIAARIARANGEAALAAVYDDLGAGEATVVPVPPMVADYCERLAHAPDGVGRADLAGLTASGVSDADIVRLVELVAFVSYQVRVLAGLRRLGAAA